MNEDRALELAEFAAYARRQHCDAARVREELVEEEPNNREIHAIHAQWKRDYEAADAAAEAHFRALATGESQMSLLGLRLEAAKSQYERLQATVSEIARGYDNAKIREVRP